MVNELVVRLSDPSLANDVRDELGVAGAKAIPDLGAAAISGPDETARRMVVRDAKNDESFFAMFAFLMLAGATFAAFNLTTRIVESQRRQIGGRQHARPDFPVHTDILAVVALFALALAVLVAYNSATISEDERTREVATMLAFGLPARRVMASAMIESGIVGVLGTLIGIAGGLAALSWLVYVLFRTRCPTSVWTRQSRSETIAAAVGLGIFAVAMAPLLTWRRLARMNLPGTLRVVE